MTICMLAYTFYETDNRVRRYAEALAKRGDAVEAIALRRKGQPSFEVLNGVHVYRIQKRSVNEKNPFHYLLKLLLFWLRSAWFISARHMRGRYDLIHVHSVPDFEVFATLLPRLLGTAVILDIHDIVPEFYASKFHVAEHSFIFKLLLLIEKLSIAYSSHTIIANHLWYEKLIRRSVKPEKCTALINYPDPAIFSIRARPTSARDEFVMCYPGTLNHHQGVDLAIKALVLLRDKLPQLKFLIIGDGPDREMLESMVKRFRLEDPVRISGFIPIEGVAETLATIDLGVVPKRKDSFGNEAFSTKIMEFMAMGVPVVASETRIDRYYFNEDLVQFFESGNAEDLAAKILELAQDSGKRETLRAHGLDFIRKNNWDVKKHDYLKLVDRLAKPPLRDRGAQATKGDGLRHPVV